jgi:hypothetical protein
VLAWLGERAAILAHLLGVEIANKRIVSFPPQVYLDISWGIFLSHTHLFSRSPTHIVPSRSQGDLSITNTPSLPPHASIFSIRPSQPLSLVCQTTLGHVL